MIYTTITGQYGLYSLLLSPMNLCTCMFFLLLKQSVYRKRGLFLGRQCNVSSYNYVIPQYLWKLSPQILEKKRKSHNTEGRFRYKIDRLNLRTETCIKVRFMYFCNYLSSPLIEYSFVQILLLFIYQVFQPCANSERKSRELKPLFTGP